MKKDLGAKAQLFPQSVFIVASYDGNGVADAMNVGWGGAAGWDAIAIIISSHQTTDNILARRAFTVAPADAAHAIEADYFGICSGREVNKEQGSKLTFTKSAHVDAPIIEEFPLTMECEVADVQELGGTTWRIIGKVVNTCVDDAVLDAEGNVDFGKLRPIVLDAAHRSYRVVSEEVAPAWEAGKVLL